MVNPNERTAKPMAYELIDHTADLGLRVFGKNPGDLFANAGRALFDQITDTTALTGTETLSLEVEGADWPDLMVNWLRELLNFWFESGLLIKEVDILDIAETRLSARLRADRFDPGRHSIKNEIKAVTYHQIQVVPGLTGWEATVIFDV